MSAHTPGSWACHLFVDTDLGDIPHFSIFQDDGYGNGNAIPCREDGVRKWERAEAEANASLIAAAPDLLAALVLLRQTLRDDPAMQNREYIDIGIQVNNAIDKARGLR